MPDTGTPEGQEPTTTTTSTEAPAGEAPPTDKWAGLPEEFAWAKSAVESANREAASRRVALREAEDKLKDAKTPEDVQAAVKDLSTKASQLEAELARERAARKHGLTDDVLEFLTGTTEEQIEAQASKLAAKLKPASQETAPPKVVTVPAPSGGVTPSTPPTEQDGRAAWRAFKARR
jgi:hypothetical protein